ncbi:MAG: hypothetical protein IPN86_16615 [Saprospiraceae bacterium]|nr:hypothetical protein [Saprospiraceae bacterium]
MTDVRLIDYLPAGFQYVAANNAAGVWTVSGTNLTANVSGPIAVCDTICVPLRLTVIPDHRWRERLDQLFRNHEYGR